MSLQPYRMAAQRPNPYVEAWARLRKRRLARRIAVGVVGYAMGSLVAVALKGASLVAAQPDNWLVMAVGFAFGAVFLAITAGVARYLVPFVCPRCGQPFFTGLFMEIGFTKNCAHCGLAVGTPASESEEIV